MTESLCLVGASVYELSAIMDAAKVVKKIKNGVSTIFLVHYRGRELTILVTGMGAKNAAQAIQWYLESHKPKVVLIMGVAGGLLKSWELGDSFVASEVSCFSFDGGKFTKGNRIEADPTLCQRIEELLDIKSASLVSADGIVATPELKGQLHAASGAVGVDLETYVLAETLTKAKVSWSCIRSISDTVDDTLPKELADLIESKSFAAMIWGAGKVVLNSGFKTVHDLRKRVLTCSVNLEVLFRRLCDGFLA